jgi:hypothetical protein
MEHCLHVVVAVRPFAEDVEAEVDFGGSAFGKGHRYDWKK